MFLRDVQLQGSGYDRQSRPLHYESGAATVIDGVANQVSDPNWVFSQTIRNVTPGLSVATDPLFVPRGTKIALDIIGSRTADDVGSSIKRYRLDIFGGTGHRSCAGDLDMNLIVVGACDPVTTPVQARGIQSESISYLCLCLDIGFSPTWEGRLPS